MMIEIQGAGFGNKGAQLMLVAIRQHLKGAVAGIQFAVEPYCGSYEQRAAYGLHQVTINREAGRAGWLIDLLMHEGYRKKYGMVTMQDVDALLDASGFAYGDTWPLRDAQRAASKYGQYKQRGKKVVMLPQSFGPFTSDDHRRAMEEMMTHADLVFARDAESMDHLRVAGLTGEHIQRAPDISLLVKGRLPITFDGERPQVCIVPNTNVLKHAHDTDKSAYIPFLVSCVRYLRSRDVEPFVLLHETKEDLRLVEHLQKDLDKPLGVIHEEDPVALKGIIGATMGMVGSRYHGLVGALSQGVPAMGVGWSHKYGCLFEDFDCADWIVHPSASFDTAEELLQVMVDDALRAVQSKKLVDRARQQEEEVLSCWHSVVDCLNA